LGKMMASRKKDKKKNGVEGGEHPIKRNVSYGKKGRHAEFGRNERPRGLEIAQKQQRGESNLEARDRVADQPRGRPDDIRMTKLAIRERVSTQRKKRHSTHREGERKSSDFEPSVCH